MRVLLVAYDFWPESPAHLFLADQLRQRGDEVTVLTVVPDSERRYVPW
jgi:hypothetical protein